MHPSLMVVVSFCLGAENFAPTSPQEPATEIATAISQLAADEYRVRQAAMEALWAAGEAAVPLLEQAGRSKNAEVRYRAQFVLENLQIGITIDTPAAILREVHRFRSDSVEARRRAMQQLERSGRPRIVLALLQSEDDPRLRDEWSAALERTLVRAIAAGKLEDVADTLRRAPDDETWLRNYAAFAAQRGRCDDELLRLDGLTSAPASDLHRRRVYLLRAKGDLAKASEYAREISPETYIQLLKEQRDWGTLARMLTQRIGHDSPESEQDIEFTALAAAYFRLAGYQTESDRLLAAIQSQLSDVQEELMRLQDDEVHREAELVKRNWYLAKALLLNGRFDEAIQAVRHKQPSFAFELLCKQQRYRDAFALIDAPYPQGPDGAWFRSVAEKSAENSEAIEQQFTIAQLVIRSLHSLGRQLDAAQWLAVLIQGTEKDHGTRRWRMLCDTAVQLGHRDRALELAARILQKKEQDRSEVLGIVFAGQTRAAKVWWEQSRKSRPRETSMETLRFIESLLKNRESMTSSDVERRVTEAAALIPNLVDGKQVEWLEGLAETCLAYGRRDLAMNFYGQAGTISVTHALKLGDLLAEERQWGAAAEWYQRAWQFDRDQPLPLFLYAQALQRAGQHEVGTRLAELALLMPLANAETRHALASGLKERGYREVALQQFELLLRTGEPDDGRLVDAAKQIGNLTHATDQMRAADLWEMLVLCCIRPKWRFNEVQGYMELPLLVHKTRAAGLLKAGRAEEALREVWASQELAPATGELAQELVPLLEAADRSREAERLLEASSNRLRELTQDFPACATTHNHLAALLVRCGRNLDDALEHAQQAVELEPSTPPFHQTLAEIYYRRGDQDKAIACAERCVHLEPQNVEYQRQLERFKAFPKLLSEPLATSEASTAP